VAKATILYPDICGFEAGHIVNNKALNLNAVPSLNIYESILLIFQVIFPGSLL
jgi:hypothetical protein